jgi:hypothetical protein
VAENDNSAMDLVVKQWGKIADATNAAVHLIHHTRKQSGTEAEVTAESSRGGKALTDGCRSVRTINRMTKEEGEKAGVENHRLFFRTYNDKANLAPPSDRSDWYELKGVSLGNGGAHPSDEMGVVARWEWPDATASLSPGDLHKVQAKIHGGTWRESAQAKDWVGHAVADVLGLDLGDQQARATIKALLRQWTDGGALKRATKQDGDRKPRPCVEVGEWANAT